MGLEEKAELKNRNTFSAFAFEVGSPQNRVDEAEITKLADTIYGTLTFGDVATIRRLHFESCACFLSYLMTNANKADSS